MTTLSDFNAGVRAVSPLVPPAGAVGLITGLAAGTVGLSPLETVVMTVVVYSPTVILTAFGLLEAGAPFPILVTTALVVGARFTLLSLSMSTYLRRLSARTRWLLAYFLWTPVFALSVERFEAHPETDRRAFYLGTAAPLWLTIQATVLAGVLFGAAVPASLQLGFVVPLAFIALVVRLVKDRPTATAAVAAGAVAVVASVLPLNTGVIVATAAGTVAGVLVYRREGI